MQWIATAEKNSATQTLEQRLWDAADQLRANSGLKAQEYSGLILGLIFLRFAEARFAAQRAKLEKAGTSSRRGSRIDDPTAYAADELDNVAVQQDDILLNITGASVARCCLTHPKYLPARVNQHVAIARVRPKLADARFVLYCINSPLFKSRLLALAQGGATREALTKTTIENFEVLQPALREQRRIAAILSAYDDLIENNLRRIRILESMAHALYREWFVEFRFPGGDNHPRVTSPLGEIPKGWEVKRLDAVCRSIQDGDWIETKDQGGDAYRLIQISNIGVGEFVETGNVPGCSSLRLLLSFRSSLNTSSMFRLPAL